MRLDKKLLELFPEKTRSQCTKLVEKELVTVNGKFITKASFRVEDSDKIVLDQDKELEQRDDLVAENLPLDILFENDDYLVINKAKGMTVHPGDDEWSQTGTVVNAVMFHCKDSLSGMNGQQRPGIVHRLDKDTTGILIIAKNDRFHAHLAKQIADRKVEKIYHTFVFGRPQDGVIEAPIARSPSDRKKMSVCAGGKEAKTIFNVLEYNQDLNISFVEVQLVTGRTHQIRVHFNSIGHPVMGDTLYGNKKVNHTIYNKFKVSSQLLHAYSYKFLDLEGKEQHFIAPDPAVFEAMKIKA